MEVIRIVRLAKDRLLLSLCVSISEGKRDTKHQLVLVKKPER